MSESIIEAAMTPSQYFEQVKAKRSQITDVELQKIYDNALTLLNKYVITGQKKGAQKLIFVLESIERERNIVKMGINTFVYREDIEAYIDDVGSNAVKIIELENFERELPEEIVTLVEKSKNLFDQFYVLFTDYTGKVEKQVEAARRDKDPILFGTLQDRQTRTLIERFYFIGDWVDEYCDLTLDKMVATMQERHHGTITLTISTPEDVQALKKQLQDTRMYERTISYGSPHDEDSEELSVSNLVVNTPVFKVIAPQPHWLKRVRTFLKL